MTQTETNGETDRQQQGSPKLPFLNIIYMYNYIYAMF